MSRGLRWTPEELAKRGWRAPASTDALAAKTLQAAMGAPYTSGVKPDLSLEAALRKVKGKRLIVPPPKTVGEAFPGLFQPRQAPKRARKVKSPIPYERDVLRAVLACLRAHPRVSWVVRVNTGSVVLQGKPKPRVVRFGFVGCSDIIGQMVGGAMLAVEVKRPGKKPTMEQAAFLLRVREAGGTAFVADSVNAVLEQLGPLTRREQLGELGIRSLVPTTPAGG